MKRVIVSCTFLLLASCISGPSVTGIRLGDETLKQFKANETTEDWLVAVIGPPTSKSIVPNVADSKVYRYTTVEEHKGFLSFLTGKASLTTATVYFIIRKGIVIQFWADRDSERTLFGKEVDKKNGEKVKG